MMMLKVRRAPRLAAAVALLVAPLAGCTPGTADTLAAANSATVNKVAAPTGSATISTTPGATELPLINTSTVLFPQHDLNSDSIETQKQLFFTGLSDIAPVENTIAKVTEVRTGPGATYEVMGVKSPGDAITVDGQLPNWYRIADNGGYISAAALAEGAANDVAWSGTVGGAGDESLLDNCTGELIEFSAMSEDLGVPAYHLHSYCGGEGILDLVPGDVVQIDGQRYTVGELNDSPLYSSTLKLRGMAADAFLQTCDLVNGNAHTLSLLKTGSDESVATSSTPTSTTPATPYQSDKLRVGIRFQQPGIGELIDGQPSGFDVDVAAYIAWKLGYSPYDIEWVEAKPTDREQLLQSGAVDFIAATYSMTDARAEQVDFAGPYLVTGQDLLVRADDASIQKPADLGGKTLCTVPGSTSQAELQAHFGLAVTVVEADEYADCAAMVVAGQADAVSTDDVILAGLAASDAYYGLVRLVGVPFTQERYGIGLPPGSTELCEQVSDALTSMVDDGSWQRFIDRHTGGTGYTPDAANPPALEPCE